MPYSFKDIQPMKTFSLVFWHLVDPAVALGDLFLGLQRLTRVLKRTEDSQFFIIWRLWTASNAMHCLDSTLYTLFAALWADPCTRWCSL